MGGGKNNGGGNGAKGGVTAVGLLQILFIAFKLAEIGVVAEWEWWKVMLPTICTVSLGVTICCCAGVVGCAAMCMDHVDEKNQHPRPVQPVRSTTAAVITYEAGGRGNDV